MQQPGSQGRLALQATQLLMDEQVAGGWTRGEAVASRVVRLRGVLVGDGGVNVIAAS
eukprot:COSAG01_NODE_4365_length_5094_cov_1.949750_2_plen_57_part_00